MKLSPRDISEVLAAVEDAQAASRLMLGRWLKIQGYDAAALSAPSSHILDRLQAARKAEDQMFTAILHESEISVEERRRRQSEAAKAFQQRKRDAAEAQAGGGQ